MCKLYLIVDMLNVVVIYVYEKCGFQYEVELKEEFFGNGVYYNVYWMCIFQCDYFEWQWVGVNNVG